jgi:hypothetical protein
LCRDLPASPDAREEIDALVWDLLGIDKRNADEVRSVCEALLKSRTPS